MIDTDSEKFRLARDLSIKDIASMELVIWGRIRKSIDKLKKPLWFFVGLKAIEVGLGILERL